MNDKNNNNKRLNIKFRFLRFLSKFTLSNGKKPYNFENIIKKFVKKNLILNINLVHIVQYDPQLYIKIAEYPNELIGFFDYILNNYFERESIFKKNGKQNKIKVSFWRQKSYNIFHLEKISPNFINKLVSVYGHIIKLTKNFSELSTVLFKCEVCDFEAYSLGEIGNIKEPIYCFLCKNFNSFQIFPSRCNFNKVAFFKIHTSSLNSLTKNYNTELFVISRNHFSEKLIVGDSIKITGILRINPYFDKTKRLDSVFFSTYLDSLCIFKSKKTIGVTNDFKGCFIQKSSLNFSIKSKNNRIMLRCLTENLNFYYFFQDSSFSEQFGIESIKKTLVSIYYKNSYNKRNFDFNNRNGINLLIKVKNTQNNSKIFKNMFSFLKKCVYMDLKIEEEKKILFSFNLQDELNETKLYKGKLFYGKYKVLCINNMDLLDTDMFFVLKEMIMNQKISIVKPGLNCLLEAQGAIIAIIKDVENTVTSKFNSKTIDKNIYSLINLFEISYVFKSPITDFFQNYLLKYFTHIFHDKIRKKWLNYIKLERVGFKSKGTQYILEFKRSYSDNFMSFFFISEVIKIGNILKILTRLKLKKTSKTNKNFFEIVKIIASSFSMFRLSKLMSVEDVRLAFLLISESFKSDELFEY